MRGRAEDRSSGWVRWGGGGVGALKLGVKDRETPLHLRWGITFNLKILVICY